ncbi:MAG: hypothetical protein JST51_04315 [Armatimonadetes bacterium]|nr:hypothetical protein [Armatimonadota bacterium]
MQLIPIAGIEPWQMALMVPIIIFMIPIVAILTSHQRKMAELMHGSRESSLPSAEIDELRRQIANLQSTVSALTISVDNLKDEVRSGQNVQDRIRVDQ